MADTAFPLVVAHQLNGEFEQRLIQALPPDISWRQLSGEAAWEVPEDAQILLAVPPRGGNIVVPAAAPAGWPRNLRWVQTASAGVDEFPDWIFDAPVVTCGRGTNSAPIAEFVLASLLAVEKKLPTIWIHDAADWQPHALGTLAGKTLGLIGYGSIGRAIAARALPFGINILATKRSVTSDDMAFGVRFASLTTVLAEADHLVIAVPLTGETAGLIGRAALGRVKPGVHLVNISRGRIVDHGSLVEALDSGQVGFASLDVTEPEPLPEGHPLYRHARVNLSPHISWSGGERGAAIATFFAKNLRRFRAGEALDGLVRRDLGY